MKKFFTFLLTSCALVISIGGINTSGSIGGNLGSNITPDEMIEPPLIRKDR
jgi:hypothetical protein